ncbi:glutamate receptor 1.2 isoform X1 [Lactuca sativa]|uniref:glutamate receptor 1.2 isoform X1 n=1 Tax=Lactuca sativa TaxID=4236 RepID=UPI000CD98E46|nr:glutamate receptor 1.2 isoform X1 [Lactuca sativa]
MAYCRSLPFLILLMLLSFQSLLTAHEDPSYKDIQVGVILDMDSWVGKVVYSCITMAVSDFYRINPHYTTRITFTTRDTKGEPLHALSAALDLLENSKVQAIIGPESTAEARSLEVLELGDKANLPILSFSTTPFFNQNPNLLRIAQDETTQFKCIASMVESFKAKNVVVICEDTANGREMANYMVSAFHEKNIHVAYTSLISTSANHEEIMEELLKLQTMQAVVYVMHTAPSLASNLFSRAKELGMMGEGYMWIVTSKTTNHLDSMDAEAIESMQGAVGFRSYFPASRELHEFVSKWRKEHYSLNPFMEFKEIDPNGIWAYDAVYALAMAVENIQTTNGMSLIRTSLLDEMLRVKFHGLGGEFNLMNGRSISKAMEVVNVIGKGGRKVGFWMMANGGEFVKEIGKPNSSSNHDLESIMLPGGTSTFAKRRVLQTNSKKLRILVPDFSTFPNLVQLNIDPRTNDSGVSGFCWDVFNAAFNALDYGVGIDIIPYPYKDGRSYNDLIDKISFKEYDAAVGDISITSNRSLYVDFTLPFTDLGIGTIAHNPKKNMWIFLDPLSADLWITSACFFLFMGFVIWFIEHRTNKEFQGSTKQQIGITLWFAFSTLVYAHREKLQSNLSRFVVTVWVFVVLVLTSSYTATLSSLLTVQQIAMKETSVGFLGLSSVGVVFNNLNFGGTKIEKLYTPEAYAKALTSGSVDAIVDEILYIKSVLSMYPDSDFSLISTASTTNGFGFAFQKGSPLAREMSTEIAKMREHGTLKALENKWLKRQSTVISKDFSSPSPKILNIYGFRGLFLISGVTMAFALLVSMVLIIRENLHVKIKMQIWRCILTRSSELYAQDSDAELTV